MADEIKNAILDNAQGPKRAQGDEGSVEQHSLQDLIAADKHLASKDVAQKPHRGLRFTKLISPGTV